MYNRIDYLRRAALFGNNLIRKSHKKLATLMFYGTDLCDSQCKHCRIWAKRPIVHLPKEKFIEVMKSKCISKNTTIGLEGGEFLLHPQANDILKWFSENHPNFELLSNCLKPQNVINAVKKYPPKRLYISLDGTKETYLRMRGRDGYDCVMEVIEKCKNLVPISLMFVLSPFNSFKDVDHVIDVARKNNLDVRIGVYNNIDYFDTVKKAHDQNICNPMLIGKEKDSKFKKSVFAKIRKTSENYDFLLLYDEWRKNNLKIKCYSILDSLVIHPNGDVPLCQALGIKLGNIYNSSLDEIFNSANSQSIQKKYANNCNRCWVNFHRKYDIVLLRTLEEVFPKKLIELFYGSYWWASNKKLSYKEFIEKNSPN